MDKSGIPIKPIFKNLDGIRFIAFLGVYVSHCFFPRSQAVKSSDLFQCISFFVGDSRWGNVGLYIFFTMSGFLITYLLIHEGHTYGKIHIASFYMRRILRIWPLYFFLLFISFFIYPNFAGYQPSTETRLAYSFFYGNFDVIKNGFDPGGIGHLWAISIEEQFYLVLPLVMFLIPIRYLHYLFLIIMLVAQVFRIIHYQEATVLYHHSLSAAFDIALGGLAAWLIYFNSKARSFVSELPRSVIIGIYFFFGGMVFLQDFIFHANQLILSLFLFQLFAAFILVEQNFANHSFFKVGNFPVISALGKYAYGFYCYHIFCIRLVETMCVKAGVSGVAGELILIPALGLLLTVATAMISYHLFEIHFLRWKNGFTYLR